MPLSSPLSRSQQHLIRYRQIISVLFKYGFEDVISSMHLEKPLQRVVLSEKRIEQINKYNRWQRIRMVMEELGTTFIKLGQLLSHRPDLIPDALVKELEKLQDVGPTFDGQEAIRIIERSLQQPIHSFLLDFEEKAFASASIAQVHKARLLSGEEVVVKVCRPGIKKIVNTDIEIMLGIARLMERYGKDMQYMNLTGIVQALEKSVKKEMNFTREAAHLERFRKNIKSKENICAPRHYKQYSSESVLTMERVHGFKITHLAEYSKAGISPQRIAEIGVNSFFRQVFINGFFHADPHPGNLFVTPEGKLCFIDFGSMGYLPPSDKDALGAIFIGIETRNSQRIIRALKQLSGTKEIENEEALEIRMLELIEDYSILNLKDIKLGDLFVQLKDIIIEFKIVVPPNFFLLGKTLAATEDIGRKLYPEINIIEYLKPYVVKLIKRKMNPVGFIKEMYLPLLDFGSLLQNFPGDLRDIIIKLKQGTLKVDIEHMGLHELKLTLEKVSNRISLAIITASMLIGSSLIVLANVPPYYNNIPLLGIIGFLVSLVFAVWLVISIIRGGNI